MIASARNLFRSDLLEQRRAIMQEWADFVAQDEVTRRLAQAQVRNTDRYLDWFEKLSLADQERVEAGLPTKDADKWYREGTSPLDFVDDLPNET